MSSDSHITVGEMMARIKGVCECWNDVSKTSHEIKSKQKGTSSYATQGEGENEVF